MITLGQKFKILRQDKGFNQKAMAALLDVSIPAYSKLETGVTDPNLSRITQIAEVHHLNIRQLFNVGEDDFPGSLAEIETLRSKIKGLELSVLRLQTKLIDFYDQDDQRRKGKLI